MGTSLSLFCSGFMTQIIYRSEVSVNSILMSKMSLCMCLSHPHVFPISSAWEMLSKCSKSPPGNLHLPKGSTGLTGEKHREAAQGLRQEGGP